MRKSNFFKFFFISRQKSYNFSNKKNEAKYTNILKIGEGNVNQRLDNFIKQHFALDYSSVQKFLRTKKIYIKSSTGEFSNPNYRLKISEEIIYPKLLNFIDSKKKLQNLNNDENLIYNEDQAKIIKEMIIHEDKDYLILNKLSNISSQGGKEADKNLLPLLNNYYEFNSPISIVHRLDKNTTGLLIMAKSKLAAQVISNFFLEQNNIEKYYLALVEGVPEIFIKKGISQGTINTPLVFHNNKMKVCNLDNEEKQNCETMFKILGFLEIDLEKNQIIAKNINEKLEKSQKSTITLLKLKIKGGKKHQIRVHLSEVLKTPVLFDRKYGFGKSKLERFLINEQNLKNFSKTENFTKNLIKFNGKVDESKISAENSINDKWQIESFVAKEYFSLHAIQIFIKTDTKVTNFREFLEMREGDLNGEIEIQAKLPGFLNNLLNIGYKSKFNDICEEIYKIKFSQ